MTDYTYSIIDLSGKLISKGEIDSNITKIDIRDLKNGKYVLNLQNLNTIISGFFILK